jgi:hypothetical protein
MRQRDEYLSMFRQRALEYVMDVDHKWFERHPKDSEYVRRAVDGEWSDAELAKVFPQAPDPELFEVWTKVRQLGPGLRARTPALCPKGAKLELIEGGAVMLAWLPPRPAE